MSPAAGRPISRTALSLAVAVAATAGACATTAAATAKALGGRTIQGQGDQRTTDKT